MAPMDAWKPSIATLRVMIAAGVPPASTARAATTSDTSTVGNGCTMPSAPAG